MMQCTMHVTRLTRDLVSEVLGRVPMILVGCRPAAALASYPVDSAD